MIAKTMQLGPKIIIVGSGGAGKSTLARQLGEVTGLPVIHLDAHYWQPGWVETPREEWVRINEGLVAGERWIIDGNYGGTMAMRVAAAQTIIFLDLPPIICLWRVLKRRVMYHGKTRPDLNEGCVEKIDWEFLKWICIDYPRNTRKRLLERLAQHRDEKQIIILRSPGEVALFMRTVASREIIPSPA